MRAVSRCGLGLLLVAGLVSCSSAGSHEISVEQIATQTLAARTARVSGHVEWPKPSVAGTRRVAVNGVLDFDKGAALLQLGDQPLNADGAVLLNRNGFYDRRGGRWCTLEGHVGPIDDFVFDFISLARKHHDTLTAIGTPTVRGMRTRRYIVSGPDMSHVTIWIDADFRLRRLSRSGSPEDAAAFDYFDFGAPTSIPMLPADTPAC